ncbi:MAG: flagellar basal body-associated FliL family protein [Treponema sp.]|jgi:flagellar FliL protein|nr:flagellar basal body-associated FliL family protein [Treponema sp.]
MADDDLELDGGDAAGVDSSPKKTSGLAMLLPNLLKFVAIGLGALAFIVTVTIITYNVVNKGGKSQTAVTDPLDPYVGKRPEYAFYTLIGPVTTRTRDTEKSYSVTVDMIIGYDLNNNTAQTELVSRQYELRDFVRNYFTGKYASELQPDNETKLKSDIRETLNTRFLDTAKVRIILFDKLDVMEMY